MVMSSSPPQELRLGAARARSGREHEACGRAILNSKSHGITPAAGEDLREVKCAF
jgi:hypothetical protein